MPNARAVSGFSSTSTFVKVTLSPISSSNWSITGPCIRHGPHQVAQKSTKTTPFLVSSTKFLSVNDFTIRIILSLFYKPSIATPLKVTNYSAHGLLKGHNGRSISTRIHRRKFKTCNRTVAT